MCTPPGSGTVTCRMTWPHSPSIIVGRTGRPRRLRGRRAEDAVRVEVAARAHLRPGRTGAAYTELTSTAASVVIGGLSVPLAGVSSIEEASTASLSGLTGPASTAGPGGVRSSHHYGGRSLCTTRGATHSGHVFSSVRLKLFSSAAWNTVVKRADLIRRLKAIAKAQGVEYREWEGGNHTLVWVGTRMQPVARHTEINDITAAKIIKHMEGSQ